MVIIPVRLQVADMNDITCKQLYMCNGLQFKPVCQRAYTLSVRQGPANLGAKFLVPVCSTFWVHFCSRHQISHQAYVCHSHASAVDSQPAAAFRSSIWNADVGSKSSTYSVERTWTEGKVGSFTVKRYRGRLPQVCNKCTLNTLVP